MADNFEGAWKLSFFFTGLFFHLIIVLQPKYFQIKITIWDGGSRNRRWKTSLREIILWEKELISLNMYWVSTGCQAFVKGCDAKMGLRLINFIYEWN